MKSQPLEHRPRASSRLLCLGFALSLLRVLGAQAMPVFDLGCLASDRTDQEGRRQFRALGPIVEVARDGVPTLEGVRPFYTLERDNRGRRVLDVLWPLASFRRWGAVSDWHVLTAFGLDANVDDPASRYRAWIFPILFMGRDAEGRSYHALFPIGGTVREFCGRDVSFVLFPVYSHSTLNDLDTRNFIYPLISWTRGDDLYKFRVFPVYGRSVKKGEWDKRFVMWPFWTSFRYERPGAKGGGYIFFPFWGHVKMENQESWMVLPPLIRWSVSPKGQQKRYLWPFVQTASGETDQVQVWPLYGYKHTTNETSRFVVWPIVYSRHTARPSGDANWFRVFPVYYAFRQSATNAAAGAPALERSVCLWPLFDYDRRGEHARLRVIDLWPPRNTPAIERNLAPLWTLYRYERTPRGLEHELLWGLAHWERSAEGVRSGSVFPLTSWASDGAAGSVRRWDLLKGLIGYDRRGASRQFRLFYFLNWGGKP